MINTFFFCIRFDCYIYCRCVTLCFVTGVNLSMASVQVHMAVGAARNQCGTLMEMA